MSWVSPTGYSDPDSGWSNEPNAYDEDTETYAQEDWIDIDKWSSFLYLTHEALTSDKCRFYAYVVYVPDGLIDLDVHKDGSWVDVYQGDFEENTWVEKTYTEGSVDQVRLRFYNSSGYARVARLFEFDFWEVSGGQLIEIFKDAIVKADAEKSLQTTFNIQKDAAVTGSAAHGEETTFNIAKDTTAKSLADLDLETTFILKKDAIVQALADVIVEKVAGQVIEIFKDAVVEAHATFALESIFNIDKDAAAEATAAFGMETVFNVVKDAIVKASASPQVVRVVPINVDAVVKASATPSLRQTLGISKDAVVVAVSTPLIQSAFNISPEAVVKVLAEVDVTKEKPEVIRLFLVLGLQHSALVLGLSHANIDLSLETPYTIELEVN